MRYLLFLVFIFSFNQLISQEIVGMKDVYSKNNLVHKVVDDQLFTGLIQAKRSNDHVVYEAEIKNGLLLCSSIFFNGTEKRVATKTIYNPTNPALFSKELKYHLTGELFEAKTYNEEGIKILLEQFSNGKLSYSCQYIGNVKNGLELGYLNGGDKLTYRCEYKNGKKQGIEYCLNKNGVEVIKEYSDGKRIK